MRGWGSKDKSLDNLSDRLDRLEEERGEVKPVEDNDANDRPYATAEELEQMSSIERYIAWFNWHVREIMPYYKAEVMRLHSITSDEYDSRTLEGDRSIYLPQPNPMFEPTHYDERVAHALGSAIAPKNCLLKFMMISLLKKASVMSSVFGISLHENMSFA